MRWSAHLLVDTKFEDQPLEALAACAGKYA